MTYQKLIYTLIYLCTLSQVISTHEVSACDKSKCKGPLAYYEDLKCIPIYGEDKCCPTKYNCDHLVGRSNDKCYYKGRVYEIGENVWNGSPCSPCFCSDHKHPGIGEFACAVLDCIGPQPGCYIKASHNECCSGPQICPENRTELAKCEVDGKIYLAGQRFEPQSDPTQSCICDEGYTGINEAPFCRTVEPSSCSVELFHSHDIQNNCPPVFYNDQNPAVDCNYASRCQNKDDLVLPAAVPTASDPADVCKFGNLTMKIGEELNQGTGYESVCVKCLCEVPPLPTCQRLPDSECDVTVHKKFDDL